MSHVFQRFRGAFVNHLRSWSSLWDLGVAGASVLLLTRSLPSMMASDTAINGVAEPAKDVALWLCVLCLLLASLVSYRRANALRADGAWVDVSKETNHCALLWGEILCSWCVALALVLPSMAYLGIVAPAALAPSGAWLLTLIAALALVALMAIAVFYFLSAYVLGAEGFSVLAITIVILGFSRSDVPREIARTTANVPALATIPLAETAGIATRVLTPPIEETIKAALDGTFAGRGLNVAQALLQVTFLISLSMYVVSRWGAHDLESRRRQAREADSGRAARAP